MVQNTGLLLSQSKTVACQSQMSAHITGRHLDFSGTFSLFCIVCFYEYLKIREVYHSIWAFIEDFVLSNFQENGYFLLHQNHLL